MLVSQAIALIENDIANVPGFELSHQQAELLVADAIGVPTSMLKGLKSRILTAEERKKVDRYVVAPRVPVPLFLGYCEFEGLRLEISPCCLLPGTETSAFIELASAFIRDTGARNVVELGTGSGVIAASLARRCPSCRIVATEISNEAAALALRNFRQLAAGDRVSLRIGNWYDALTETGLFGNVDLIISNPPYCREDAIDLLPEGFTDHAPRLAIDGGRDGLSAHRAVIEGSHDYLRIGGHLIVQTDDGQAEDVARCVAQIGGFGGVQFRAGSGGEERFLIACRTEST